MARFLRLSALANLISILVVFGFVVAVSTGMVALNRLKVGGPIYDRIALGKDLVADILPPPEYILEAFLEVNLAIQDPASLAARRDHLHQLHKDYDERHAYWSKQDIAPAVRDKLTVGAHKPAIIFWELTESKLLPALASGDTAAARSAYTAIAAAYDQHREQINAVVTEANRMTEETEKSAAAEDIEYTTVVWVVAGLVLVVTVASALGVLIGMIKPIRAMTIAMGRLAGGDLAITVPSARRRDEIGDMAHALESFKSNAIEATRMRNGIEQSRIHAEADRKAVLCAMADKVETETGTAVSQVAETTLKMSQTALAMGVSAEKVSRNSQAVAAAAEQALANAQAVSGATEQLSASIREISHQVSNASGSTTIAVNQSTEAHQTINSLAEAVERVGQVTSIIAQIASQTNLLALNATVEAARAGNAGKGFAVVANEVKNLATQTATSTEEIRRQISDIERVTAEAVSKMASVNDTVRSINEITTSIATAVEQQHAATGEIARNVLETTHAAQEVSARIAEVSAEAATTGRQVTAVQNDAATVGRAVSGLRRTLVHIVRTSTDDVDRRTASRFPVAWACRIQVGDKSLSGRIVNMSTGGAFIEVSPALKPGETGILSVPRLGDLRFKVLGASERGHRVRFDEGAVDAAQLEAAMLREAA